MQVPNELLMPWEQHARRNPEVVPWADLTLDWWEWLSGGLRGGRQRDQCWDGGRKSGKP